MPRLARRPELGFVVCEPMVLWPGYGADLPAPEGATAADLAVLAIVSVPKNPQEMTANLMAPIVIDCRTRTGCQLVLDTGRYSTPPSCPSARRARRLPSRAEKRRAPGVSPGALRVLQIACPS